jgi:hypothetical protein
MTFDEREKLRKMMPCMGAVKDRCNLEFIFIPTVATISTSYVACVRLRRARFFAKIKMRNQILARYISSTARVEECRDLAKSTETV